MANESEIDWLRRKMKEITDYPDGIEPVEDGGGAYINGVSFFPGGRGYTEMRMKLFPIKT